MIILEAKGLKKSYGGVHALSDGCLTLEKGAVCGLLGPNGSGKTTLSRVLAGLVQLDEGKIISDGSVIKLKTPKDSKRIGIAMAHQNLSLVNEMTVWENINLGHEKRSFGAWLDNKTSVSKAKEVLGMLCSDIGLNDKVGNLSPSNKQMVEIAKAISTNPKVLILDEPTASLEFAQVDKLFAVVDILKKRGVSIIFISHRLWEVVQICDTVTVLRDGFTVGNIDLRTIDKSECHDQILVMITGKKVIKSYKNRDSFATDEPMLKVENLSIDKTLNNISLNVNKGEIVGISGLQGQGQEELLLALSGYMPINQGEITLKDKKVNWKSAKQAIKDGVVLVPGDRHKEGLFLHHNIIDNLLYPEYCKKKSKRLIREKKTLEEAEAIIKKISLKPEKPFLSVDKLSGGNQQKVVVGKWINQSPNVLLLCDPSKGIDVEARAELHQLCRELAKDGKSILIFASDNQELVEISDRALVMFEGSIVEKIEKDQLDENKLMAASLRMKQSENELGSCE